jgi:hypothetical protein
VLLLLLAPPAAAPRAAAAAATTAADPTVIHDAADLMDTQADDGAAEEVRCLVN